MALGVVTGGVEIERKFLVAGVPDGLRSRGGVAIEQGYLAVDGPVEVRVRRLDRRHVLTIKGGEGLVRLEEEIEIEERRYRALWALTEGRRLEKRRYSIPIDDGVLLEVDEYGGDLVGLYVAEVEFSSVQTSAAFAPPDWLGPEVTGDERYANRNLALRGRPVDEP